MKLLQAMALIGPTGSGKTPLGDELESNGFIGRRCVHFDFGACLRLVATSPVGEAGLTSGERDVIVNSLRTGDLLEDRQFPIAAKILAHFIEVRGMAGDDLLILNGLPRHAGQAEALREFIDVRMVSLLECSARDVSARIRGNTGGDRTGRTDDDQTAIARKLNIFAQRTKPLVDYYVSLNVRIFSLPVRDSTTAGEMVELLTRLATDKC